MRRCLRWVLPASAQYQWENIVSVNAVGSGGTAHTQSVRPQSETREAHRAGRDVKNDGDADDGAQAVQAPKPTVNSSGQTIGSIISEKA